MEKPPPNGPLLAIDPKNSKNGNDGGQGKRHGKDFEQNLTTMELPPRQGKRHGQCNNDRQQR